MRHYYQVRVCVIEDEAEDGLRLLLLPLLSLPLLPLLPLPLPLLLLFQNNETNLTFDSFVSGK